MDPEIIKDLNELNKSLHLSNLSIKNRLLSIERDYKYISKIHDNHYKDFPIIPNERCGKWYLSTPYDSTCYFKSTDGHTNNWSFSTRRLNLHLFKIIRKNNGIIIIDSTRRGKKIPDSFSKTIPIWISIMNKFINPNKEFNELFFTPYETISNYEIDRILKLLPIFKENIIKFKDLIISQIIDLNDNRILRPFWIYPGCKKLPIFTGFEDFIPIILISASERSLDGENKSLGFSYVQGAGDDHELWSFGLTPELFWENYKSKFNGLANMDDDEVKNIVLEIVHNNDNNYDINNESIFWNEEDINNVDNFISFGKLLNSNITFKKSELSKNLKYDKIIILDSTFKYINDNIKIPDKIFQFMLDSGSKKSSKLFRKEINEIMKLFNNNSNEKILILCNSGEDMSIGVILCYLNMNKKSNEITKDSIRSDLISLIGIKRINPQRATLNSVNSYLMK